MSSSVIDHLTRGTYCFLAGEPAEIRRAIPHAEEILPRPQTIFPEEETSAPLIGFPILRTQKLLTLERALAEFLQAECEAQFAYHMRMGFDSRAYAEKWERYRAMLSQAMENVTVARHGGNYAGIFWLYHSLEVAQYLQAIPRQLRRQDLTLGREHGDAVKYKVFFKWIDKVVTAAYDSAHSLASELEEDENALFAPILALMRDNVLIFTEDYIGPDLKELSSYFQGCLNIEGRDLRSRLAAVEKWHRKSLRNDAVLRGAVTHLLSSDPREQPPNLLSRHGYVSFLSNHVSYSPQQLLPADKIQVWESLAQKLKEFEILNTLRKMMVPLEVEDGALVCRHRPATSKHSDTFTPLKVSNTTRPVDFTAAWVVNPVVQRFGLVYDITDFSSTISMLGRAEKMAIEDAFRMTSMFQRKINKLASSLDLRLEKYLGDGAFYSGRHARRMLVVAVYLQRAYPQALERGFPFKSGLRIAMNYGEYRLMPLEGTPANGTTRYEFFGHGLVELSRLSTGKKTQELEEFKTYLISQGYPETVVNKFFSPLLQSNSELVSKIEESRNFYAYINQNSALINEGIVATEPFVSRLGAFNEMYFVKDQDRAYIAVAVEEDVGGRVLLGIRKLGTGKFKGLDPMPVYEIVDGGAWDERNLKKIPPQKLMGALERLFMSRLTAAQQRQRAATATPVTES
ncbi:MAG: hypothetical protein GY719_38785 [bacterium]|nr:hypothetical protein [bacterium]